MKLLDERIRDILKADAIAEIIRGGNVSEDVAEEIYAISTGLIDGDVIDLATERGREIAREDEAGKL